MARRNVQQKQPSRRNQPASTGRRVTSQGGFPGNNKPLEYNLVQQLAHSAQRFYNGQSPTGLRPQTMPMRPVGGGQDKSPGPGGKGRFDFPGPVTKPGAGPGGGPVPGPNVNPGGMPIWGELGPGATGWPPGGGNGGGNGGGPPSGMNVNPGGTMHGHGNHQHDHQGGGPGHTHDVNPGGLNQDPATAQQIAKAQAFPNYNAYVNHYEDWANRMPGPDSTLMYVQPPVTRQDYRGPQVNPGGLNIPGPQGGPGNNMPQPQPNQPLPGGGGGGQGGPPPQYVQNWMPPHPEAFARRFPTYADYTAGVQDPRRQAFYDWAMSQQAAGGGQNGQGGGQGGGGGGQGGGQGGGGQGGGGGGQGGGGGGQQPDLSATPGNYPTPNSYLPPGSPPVPGAGTPMTTEPASLTGAPPGSYPWAGQGYQAPPSNMTWYNPGVGGFAGATPPTQAPVSFDAANALAQQYGVTVGLGQPPNQLPNPSGGTQPWWANPAPPGPGVYDPWVENRLIHGAYKPTGGDFGAFQNAYLQAAGGDNAYTRLAMQQYLAHLAGYQGYGTATAPSPYGYVAGQGG